jgi:hypothetical protein
VESIRGETMNHTYRVGALPKRETAVLEIEAEDGLLCVFHPTKEQVKQLAQDFNMAEQILNGEKHDG